jgi:hypothetical protein
MSDELSDFLNHRSSDSSGSFLKGWKKEGEITVFLHTKVVPIPLWVHNLPKIFLQDVKGSDDKVRRIFGGEYVCWEAESTLKAQHKRDDDGNRTHPPQKCPDCRLVECVRDMVDEGQLGFTQPIFKFVADDPEETRIINAGGLYGGFGDSASKEELKAMRDAGISMSKAWTQNAYAKCKYVFYVVNADKPGDGVMQTVEAGLLGDKVKDVINDAMDSAEDPALGSPFKHPYAIKWMFDDAKGIPFNKKYSARKMDKVKASPEIMALITGDKPDVSKVLEKFKADAMRLMLERACLVKNIPWDHIFGGPRREGLADNPDVNDVAGEGDASFDHGANAGAVEDDGLIECDTCHKGMPETSMVCPHCGQHYAANAAGEVVPVAPPVTQPRPRKRSDVSK